MPTDAISKQAEAVRLDLQRLEASLGNLLDTIGGAVGAAVSKRVREPLATITDHLTPLITFLSAAPRRSERPTPDGPSKVNGVHRKRRAGSPGGRGRKANLTSETIADALKQTNGNKSAAAKALGVSEPTFYKYLRAADASAIRSRPRKAAKTAG